jgi:hypothetical protein
MLAIPPFQFLPRPNTATPHSNSDRRSFPVACRTNARTCNAKIISNAASRFRVLSYCRKNRHSWIQPGMTACDALCCAGAIVAHENQLACGQQ